MLTRFKVAQGPVWQPELGKMGSVFVMLNWGKESNWGGERMAIPSLFKAPLQSLCRTHCALTTIALVCALVLGTSFLWISAVRSCPFHSVSTLHFHAPPVLRKGLRNMPPIMITSTLLSSCPVLSHNHHPQSFLSCYVTHTIKKIKIEKERHSFYALFVVHFFAPRRESLYSYILVISF